MNQNKLFQTLVSKEAAGSLAEIINPILAIRGDPELVNPACSLPIASSSRQIFCRKCVLEACRTCCFCLKASFVFRLLLGFGLISLLSCASSIAQSNFAATRLADGFDFPLGAPNGDARDLQVARIHGPWPSGRRLDESRRTGESLRQSGVRNWQWSCHAGPRLPARLGERCGDPARVPRRRSDQVH